MRFLRLFCFCGILLTSLIFEACVPDARPMPSPTPQPEIATLPTSVINQEITPQSTDPAVLNACPVDEQARAMRASQIPDWQRIGISTCYLLTLDLSDSSSVYSGTETVVFHNQTGNLLNEIVMRVFPNASNIYNGKLTIHSVKIDQKDAVYEYFLSDQSALRIKLNQPLLPGKIVRIELTYGIEMPLDFGSSLSYGIFSQSSNGPALNLANWYPILAVYESENWQADPVLMGGDAVTSQTALYKVTITAPDSWRIASTGTQINLSEEQGLSKHTFASGPVRDFMIAASPAFEMSQTQVDDITIVQWGNLETEPGWASALDDARSILTFYENTFGPYPFNELDIVAAQLQNASGVEYPGLILIIDDSYQSTRQLDFLHLVIAHEIAHQWWYSIIGNDVLRDPWQDEALATFSSLMYLQSLSPSFDLFERYKAQVEDYDRSNPGQSIDQPLDAFQGRVSEYGMVVYMKGAMFLNDVRKQMGDIAFTQALKAYYRENQYQLVSPVKLLESFAQSCQCDLDAIKAEYGVHTANP